MLERTRRDTNLHHTDARNATMLCGNVKCNVELNDKYGYY